MEGFIAFVIVIILFALSQYTEPKKTSNDKKEMGTSLFSEAFAKWKVLMASNLLSIVGWFVYGGIALHLLYRFAFAYLPSESLAIVKTIPSFATIEFIIFVVGSVILYRMYREKHPKKIAMQKETKVSFEPPKEPTMWSDWKTWVMIALGYVLWGIAQALQIFHGGPFHPGIAILPDGMFYLPYSGIFYAVLLGAFVVLAMCSVDPRIRALGFAFGIFCFIASLENFWFVPHNVPNMVYIPAMRFLGGTGILFPADPVVSWQWIAAGVGTLWALAKSCGKKSEEGDFIGIIVLMIAVSLFFPQLLHQLAHL